MKTLLSWWNMSSDKGAFIVVLGLAMLLLTGILIEAVPHRGLKKAKGHVPEEV